MIEICQQIRNFLTNFDKSNGTIEAGSHIRRINMKKKFTKRVCTLFCQLYSLYINGIKSDSWYKRWCDYGGSYNRSPCDYRCKIIPYWIFLIKLHLLKEQAFVSCNNYIDTTVSIYMRNAGQGNSEATIQKCSFE